jgi:putative phosphoesterase
MAHLEAEMASQNVKPTVVITGHSHKPSISESDGVLFVNPGSAGPRRFRLPVSVATLRVERGRVHAHIHELQIG